jgi:DNA modification methylase
MATLLLGDCLTHMAALPDRSIDCFICDLPYGQMHCEWDKCIDLSTFWKHVERLSSSAHTPIIMFCNTKFGIQLINSNPSWFRHDLVWDKGRGRGFLNSGRQPLINHEMIYVFSKKGAYYKNIKVEGEAYKGAAFAGPTNVYSSSSTSEDCRQSIVRTGRCVKSIISAHKSPKRGLHPTEKPEELYRWLLERYCPEGGCVLDPTAGSFNSITVARALGLKAIGIEADRGYFYKAVAKFSRT